MGRFASVWVYSPESVKSVPVVPARPMKDQRGTLAPFRARCAGLFAMITSGEAHSR